MSHASNNAYFAEKGVAVNCFPVVTVASIAEMLLWYCRYEDLSVLGPITWLLPPGKTGRFYFDELKLTGNAEVAMNKSR